MNEDIVWIREELEKNQENLCDRTMLNSYRSDFNSSTLQHVADVHLSETSRNDQEVVESCPAHIGNYSIVNEENESDLCPSAADEFNISEYERNLQKNTKETMNLVKNLCDRSDNLKEQQRSILMKLNEEHLERCKAMDEIQKINEINAKLCEERNELKNEVLNKQTSRASRKDSDQINLQRIEWHSIDSARLGDCYLVEPIGGMILPNFNVLISDHQAGLFVFSIDSQFIRKVTNADWKWPQAVALWDQNKILVILFTSFSVKASYI